MQRFNITIGGMGMQNNLNLTPKQNSLELPNRNDSLFLPQAPSAMKRGPEVWQDRGGPGNQESGLLGPWLTHHCPCPRDEPAGLSFCL